MPKRVSLLLIILSLTTTLNATTYNCATFAIPGASSTYITGINNSGTLVGSYITGNVTHGFFANSSSGSFQTVDYPGAANTRLFAINNNGVATGSNTNGQTSGGFTVDSNLNFNPVTAPAGYSLSSIYGINDNGAISAIIVNTSTSQTTFAILNPDGTFAPVAVPGPGSYFSYLRPGSINTTPKMLDNTGSTAYLADTSGNLASVPIHIAYGLNNAGIVVGYSGSPSRFGDDGPYTGYWWDSSTGVRSELVCPGAPLTSNTPLVYGISDNGVVVGGTQIMTPVPGEPQISLSTNSVTFPPVPVGQTTPTQNVTLTNTGNARLDIAQINETTGEVSISGCIDPSSKTGSLDPGGTCTLGLSATPKSQGTQTGTIYIHDSVSGSPQTIAVSVAGAASTLTCTTSSSSTLRGPQASFTFQDTSSGMQSITILRATNATVNIPTFASGSTAPVTATATQNDPSQSSRVDLRGTNVAGSSIDCGQTFGTIFEWSNLGGSFSGKVALARDINSNIHAFVRGGDNALWHIAQTSSGSWSGWESLGGSLSGDPVVPNPDSGVSSGIYVFGRGTDGALWYINQLGAGSWSPWTSLGGAILGDPGAVSDGAGLTEVYAVGTDQALWSISQTSTGGPWGSWSSFGGAIISDPFVGINAQGGTEVLVIAPDQTLWRTYKTAPDGTWVPWQGLGGSITGNPTALVVNNGLEVLARGTDNALWELVQAADGSWGNWVSLGGYITSNPSMALDSNAAVEAFARGGDNALWEISVTSSGAWTGLGGALAGQPTAILNDQSHVLEVFVEGTDTSLWYITQTAPGSWN